MSESPQYADKEGRGRERGEHEREGTTKCPEKGQQTHYTIAHYTIARIQDSNLLEISQ